MTRSELVAEGLSVTFPGGMRALRDVNLRVGEREIVGLVGESGSGKSTLGRVIVGLQHSYSGTLTFAGEALDPRRTTKQRGAIQMVFQDPYASLDPRMTVWQLLDELLSVHRIGSGREDRRHRCEDLMRRVHLPVAMLDSRPVGMSGGQRQRVAIARALAVEPRFLVADEPTAALDVSVQARIINLFADLREEMGLSQLFISHNLAVVRSLCDRVAVIYRGEIVEMAATDAIFEAPQHDYTRQLLAAAPDLP
ncbi:ABC transporter ATP-binding protein [Pseudaminobacter soli (ex Li et al. 2025)]|uniref:ABC transporter ATP-binding protein n=1 Tax=Pseudaminobacter soli (ex Li et al. 2025) TaxID=1295366 RepID=A0A2P7SKC5_9HYPH|nr:ABC transporter ATP-binding protein [Mesorhizobium soli]PSJ62801.1 ABC transporter ATP-binding protein [Mesorhizobium soli]